MVKSELLRVYVNVVSDRLFVGTYENACETLYSTKSKWRLHPTGNTVDG